MTTNYKNPGSLISVKSLKKLFEDIPEKTNITFRGKCSDCGCEVIIEITPVAGGYGLQGGALFNLTLGGYIAKCPDCYKKTAIEHTAPDKPQETFLPPKP
jgi:hypothetical protein